MTDIDEQEEFLQSVLTLWRCHPEMTFGHLVIQIYCGLNNSFSQLAFTRFPNEAWQNSVNGILETLK